MTDRDAAVDAVMAAVDEHESYGTPHPEGHNLFAHQEHRAGECPAVRAAVEQYGREQWDNGRYDALRMVFSEDTIRRAADMTYYNVERELAELERQRGAR